MYDGKVDQLFSNLEILPGDLEFGNIEKALMRGIPIGQNFIQGFERAIDQNLAFHRQGPKYFSAHISDHLGIDLTPLLIQGALRKEAGCVAIQVDHQNRIVRRPGDFKHDDFFLLD